MRRKLKHGCAVMTERHFTNAEKCREAEREVALRRHVFPRWVSEKKMRQEIADYRIALMQSIADDYKKLAENDEPEIKFPER